MSVQTSLSQKPALPRPAVPILAILRGVTPTEASAVVSILINAGIRLIELTLNTANALQSLSILSKHYGTQAIFGAGTVLNKAEVEAVAAAGGQFIVSPNTHPAVIKRTKALGLYSIPGALSPTEVLRALEYGADMVKLFPASVIGTRGIRALKAVIPPATPLIPTGGIVLSNDPAVANSLAAYLQADCWSIGLGANLYTPGSSLAAVQTRSENAVAIARSALTTTT